MICSSLNLLRFIFVRLLRVGLYSKSITFQGSTSAPAPAVTVKYLESAIGIVKSIIAGPESRRR